VSRIRAAALVLATTAALAVPAAAQAAATPPVAVGPTPASLAASLPNFSWTLGPAGERVSSITISASSEVDSTGDLVSFSNGGRYLSSLEALTSTTSDRGVPAGTWYWTAHWKTAEGAADFEYGNTAVQSFVIPAWVRGLRGSFIQYHNIPAFMAKGSYLSNGRTAVVTCTIYDGRRLVSRQRKVDTYPYVATTRNNFYCSDLKVPERLDGHRMKLVVQVVSGGAKSVAVKPFRAT
jgi:hypothetical protein